MTNPSDPWYNIDDDERDLRIKMDTRNKVSIEYSDLPEERCGTQYVSDTNQKHQKKKVKFGKNLGSNNPLFSNSGSITSELSSVFVGSEEVDKQIVKSKLQKKEKIKAVINGDLSRISTNEPLPPNRIEQIKELLEQTNDAKIDSRLQTEGVTSDRLNFIKHNNNNSKSMREELNKKQTSDLIGQYFSGEDNHNTEDQHFTSMLSRKPEDSQYGYESNRNKKIKLSGGFKFLPISSKPSSDDSQEFSKMTKISPTSHNSDSQKIVHDKNEHDDIPTFHVKTIKIDSKLKSYISGNKSETEYSSSSSLTFPSSSKKDINMQTKTNQHLKIGIGGISQNSLGSKLMSLPEYYNFVSAVTFCDCRCDGCEHDHVDKNGLLKKNTKCYYKTTNSKIEYCIFDKKWTRVEFDSKILNDMVMEPICVMETSIDYMTSSTRKFKDDDHKIREIQIRKKISLQTTIELIESGQQILPVFVGMFFTSNLGAVTLSKSEPYNESICWTNILSNIFHNDKEGIKKNFLESDIVTISNIMKRKNSFNRMVCSNCSNRKNSECFDILLSQNTKTFTENGSVRLATLEEKKSVLDTERVGSVISIKGKSYKYTKSNLVAIIDSRVTGHEDVIVRSCFVLSEMSKKYYVKNIHGEDDKNDYYEGIINSKRHTENDIESIKGKMLSMIGSFNSGEKIMDDKNPKDKSDKTNINSIGRDSLTESACFRPVFYKLITLEDKINTVEGNIWNDVKNMQIWTYSRSFIILCPHREYEENSV